MSPGQLIQRYDQYLVFRNYDPAAGKLAVLKRALITSWGEAGFHRFWQVWNPGVGYYLYRLYRWLIVEFVAVKKPKKDCEFHERIIF